MLKKSDSKGSAVVLGFKSSSFRENGKDERAGI